MKDFKYRKSRCADCGFTKGTDANKSGVTEIKANLCAEIPEPFYCHFNSRDNELPDGGEVLCQGFVEKCNELESAGFYKSQPEWQRELKLVIVETISEVESSGMTGEQMQARVNDRIMEYLNQK